MNIGFDAKRAYHNGTGLGFFSRTLIHLLSEKFPDEQYYLFNPRPGSLFQPKTGNIHEILPTSLLHKMFRGAWRSKWVTKDCKRLGIDLYHGLSQEIPSGIPHTGIPSVVTIHDLFAELYPQDFKPLDVKIYRSKLRYACKKSNKIMAISKETQSQIVDKYQIDPSKIEVIYQSCDPIFGIAQSDERKSEVQKKYNLPHRFFLQVGSIIERKNLLNVCKALALVRHEINIPLVVIGNGKAYKEKAKQYLADHALQDRVIFLSDQLLAEGKKPFVSTEDLPAIYQLAVALVYPSYYEGFGIPMVEAMSSGLPVITSTTSCLPEIAGDAAFLADPHSPEALAAGLRKLYGDEFYRQQAIAKGFENAQRFAPERYVNSVMEMYKSVLKIG